MFDGNTLKDKSILVTGGGSGLGLAMADAFSKLGAGVAICGRTEEKLKSAAARIAGSGNPVMHYVVDVRDFDAVGNMMDTVRAELGGLNGLVNNAAGNFLFPSEDLSPNAFKTVVDIVLHGTFNCTQHFAKHLIGSGDSGTILNIVTTYTSTGSAFVMPSACAKAGVLAMTNTLAAEWAGYKIRVNAIAPGPFPTEGAWNRLMPDPEMEEAYKKRLPAGRYGEHVELANLAVFLMSDLSPYITGECVTIDGGEHLMSGQFNSMMQMAPRGQLKSFFHRMKPEKK